VDHIEQLLIDVKESLEREIRDGFARMDARFDTQATRLDRQGGLLNAGSRWSSRMDTWAEKIDAALETKDREIADLRERLIRLEKKSA
jgi:hypothetical protein